MSDRSRRRQSAQNCWIETLVGDRLSVMMRRPMVSNRDTRRVSRQATHGVWFAAVANRVNEAAGAGPQDGQAHQCNLRMECAANSDRDIEDRHDLLVAVESRREFRNCAGQTETPFQRLFHCCAHHHIGNAVRAMNGQDIRIARGVDRGFTQAPAALARVATPRGHRPADQTPV